MSRQTNAAPILIKRKKVVAAQGHHGGAWKVAYADFVTAMMAFFLMMWLLGATTETQRRGLADYFTPSIPINRSSSGGSGMFGGNDIHSADDLGPETNQGNTMDASEDRSEADSFEAIEDRLQGLGAESATMTEALRHVVTRVTDEGLVIELFDLPGAPLFHGDTDEPEPILSVLASILAEVFGMAQNSLAIEGHTRTYTMVQLNDPRWTLSLSRAARMRLLLESQSFDPSRTARVTGHADRRQVMRNPMSVRNNRLELILLRQSG
ncbi:MAG: chemotaxis protein MotB [Rhodobacteraceae bacterium HLUCCA12]|nr:MAG: chemotaxis protein MotB [Rhodobacteraceae bacterium HLUCCA12]